MIAVVWSCGVFAFPVGTFFYVRWMNRTSTASGKGQR